MFSSHPVVNQLTALLLAHGLTDIVACPGSRNAPLLHNFREAGLTLHPATDERSAAFVALGIVLATERPAAVCVTSGSALLATLPAVAEAYYRQLPLLVVSADRPAAWIGQLDGQTLPQSGALLPYCPTRALGEGDDESTRWANNRLINEALLSLHDFGGGPAHLNVPLAEPLFQFSVPALPEERKIERIRPEASRPLPASLVQDIARARLPMLLFGQYDRGDLRAEVDALDREGKMLVVPEILSDVRGSFRMNVFDALDGNESALLPDLVVQIGGNFVHKRFKQLLRHSDCRVVRIGLDRELPDTFCRLAVQVCASPVAALHQLVCELPARHAGVEQALRFYRTACRPYCRPEPAALPPMERVLLQLRQSLSKLAEPYALHLANSSAVRAAAHVFPSGEGGPILGNRGTNGIEGSLSVAVGYALKMWGLSLVVTGDLSFFYDANALWNTRLPANLRILLLNNHGGAIFHRLPGLEASPALPEYIAAGGQPYTAQGIAATFRLGYAAASHDSLTDRQLSDWLAPADRAQLLEVSLPIHS